MDKLKIERGEKAEKLLTELLKHFRIDSKEGLMWSYIEYTSIIELESDEFEKQLREFKQSA